MRISYYQYPDEETEPVVGNITWVKKMIKNNGGRGYTEHYERDGTLFEVSHIELKGNNSSFKYNRHL